jgi:hypothetical protein
MLPKSGLDALKALLELAIHPGEWRSSQDLQGSAQAQRAVVMPLFLPHASRTGKLIA